MCILCAIPIGTHRKTSWSFGRLACFFGLGRTYSYIYILKTYHNVYIYNTHTYGWSGLKHCGPTYIKWGPCGGCHFSIKKLDHPLNSLYQTRGMVFTTRNWIISGIWPIPSVLVHSSSTVRPLVLISKEPNTSTPTRISCDGQWEHDEHVQHEHVWLTISRDCQLSRWHTGCEK